MLNIKPITFDELSGNNNFNSLIEEYEKEVLIKGIPSIRLKIDLYKQCEQNKTLKVFGAFTDEKLIGFTIILSPILPHFSLLASITESLFVAKEYRNTGAGLKLIGVSEAYAGSIGSFGLLISAPSGGCLEELLLKMYDYNKTNSVFFRNLTNV